MTKLEAVVLNRPHHPAADVSCHADMIWIPKGTFNKGSDRHYADEAPVRWVTVGPFWTDIAPVTNCEFHRSVAETGYVTSAETPPDSNDYQDALHNMLKAGAMIFNPPKHAVDTHNSTTNVGFRCIVRRAGGRLDRVGRGAVLRESAA